MTKRIKQYNRLISGLTLGLLCLGNSQVAEAQLTQGAETPFIQRFSRSGHIGYATVGGSFRIANGDNDSTFTAGSSYLCGIKTSASTNAVATNSGFTNGMNAIAPASSRQAFENVPAGATIVGAYLYWGSSAGYTSTAVGDTNVDLTIAGQKFNINGTAEYSDWSAQSQTMRMMNAYVDLSGNTALMNALRADQANPQDIIMDNLQVANASNQVMCSAGYVWANWGLYIVYQDTTLPSAKFYIYDGLLNVAVTGADPAVVTATGFQVANTTLDKVSKVTVMVGDGDPNTSSTDSFTITTDKLDSISAANSENLVMNFFNGTVSSGAVNGTASLQTNTTSAVSKTMGGGLDFDTLDIASKISSGTTTLNFALKGNGADQYFPQNIAFMAGYTIADLKVAKTVDSINGTANSTTNPTIKVGDTVRYKIVVDNSLSPVDEAYNVVTTDTMPAGLSLSKVELSYDGGVTASDITSATTNASGTLTFPTVRRLDKDGTVWGGTDPTPTQLGTKNLVYYVTATVNGSSLGLQENTASVTSGTYETATTNNTSKAQVTVVSPALTVDKSTAATSFTRGSTGTYTLKISNTGNQATTGNINIRDLLPAGMTFASVSTSSGTVTGGTVGSTGEQQFVITPPAGGLAAASSFNLTVNVNILPTATGSLTNKASVGGGGTPAPTDPNVCATVTTTGTATACDTVTTPLVSQLTLSKIWNNATTNDKVNLAISGAGVVSAVAGTSTAPSTTTNATASVVSGGAVTITETMTTGTGYNTTWICQKVTDNSVVASGTGLTGNITVPTDSDVTCTFYNTKITSSTLPALNCPAGSTAYTLSGTAASASPNITQPYVWTNGGSGTKTQTFTFGTSGIVLTATSNIQNDYLSGPAISSLSTGGSAITSVYKSSSTFSGTTMSTFSIYSNVPVLKMRIGVEDIDNQSLYIKDQIIASGSPVVFNTDSTYTNVSGNTVTAVGGKSCSTSNGNCDAVFEWGATSAGSANARTLTYSAAALGYNGDIGYNNIAVCVANPSVTLQKNFVKRLTDTDQVTLSIAPTGTSVNAAKSQVTTGSGNVVTSAPITVNIAPEPTGTAFSTFKLSEVVAGSTNLANYTSSYTCNNNGTSGSTLASGTAATFNYTPVLGDNFSCTFTNIANNTPPHIILDKYARNTVTTDNFSKATGSGKPSDTLQYCIAYNNTGGAAKDFVLTDLFPANTSYASGTLIYVKPAPTNIMALSTTPTAAALPSGATNAQGTYTQPYKNADGVTYTNRTGSGVQLTLPTVAAGETGAICFNAKIN